jgi:hypothetical protein
MINQAHDDTLQRDAVQGVIGLLGAHALGP